MKRHTARLTQKLRTAAQRYLDLRDRRADPEGTFDRGGRWHPAETLACCGAIRTPSRAWPYSYLLHCRTVAHVAAAQGYPAATLRAAAKRVEAEQVQR